MALAAPIPANEYQQITLALGTTELRQQPVHLRVLLAATVHTGR
jgi:hypothetical protein